MYRWLWLMALLVWTASLPARDHTVVQPGGTRITTHRVSLLGVLPAPCIALEARGGVATIVLSRDTVDRLAARDEHAVENKISRMDFLASGRARELLKLLVPGRDHLGCQRLRGKPTSEIAYLVGWLLEQGRAAVFTPRFSGPEPAVVVRHTDTALFGTEDFLLPDGTVIWGYGVWVS
jgi:hypothetical protein